MIGVAGAVAGAVAVAVISGVVLIGSVIILSPTQPDKRMANPMTVMNRIDLNLTIINYDYSHNR
jgi:hypothetical protein